MKNLNDNVELHMAHIFHKVDVPGPPLGRGALWFDSCKRPLKSLHFGWPLTGGSTVYTKMLDSFSCRYILV